MRQEKGFEGAKQSRLPLGCGLPVTNIKHRPNREMRPALIRVPLAHRAPRESLSTFFLDARKIRKIIACFSDEIKYNIKIGVMEE